MTILIIVGIILLAFLWYVLTPRKRNDENHKMWNFNDDAWHARYYKWVNGDDLPKGGCEYFWSIVGLIVFSPIIFLIYGIYKFISLFDSKKPKKQVLLTDEQWELKIKKREENQKRREKASNIVGKIFGGLVALLFLAMIIIGIIKAIKNPHGFLQALLAIGIVLGVVGVIIGIRWIWNKFKFGRKMLKVLAPLGIPFKYIGSMIVAIYTKSCPKITWNDNKNPVKNISGD